MQCSNLRLKIDDDDDFCYKRVQTPGMSPPRAGRMCLLSLHAIGFDFETSEDTMSGRVQREEATMNRNIHG